MRSSSDAAMNDDLYAFRAQHAAFVKRRRILTAAGADPRLASALANLGIESVEMLRAEAWEGPGGLRERLTKCRLVGDHMLQAAEEFRRRAGAEP
jgi:hypothetical protein